MPITDAGWLLIEDRETPMHVAGLQLFTLPEDVPPDFLRVLYERVVQVAATRPFNQRLERPYGRAGMYSWTEDSAIDLEYHVRHSALPKPGRVRELLALVSRLHSTLLDRHRPLWELNLIEGLDDGRVALYTKFHHSMFDGVGAIRQALASFSTDPDIRELPPPWAIPPKARKDPANDTAESAINKAMGPVAEGRSMAKAARALAKQVRNQRKGVQAEVAPFQAPRSLLNGSITGSRRFAGDAYELDRFKAIGKAAGATVNDVALAACSGALRGYLSDLDALPDAPLIALCPVSIRTDEGAGGGNAITMLLADLATDEADPAERLGRIKESMDRGKLRLKSMTARDLVNYGLLLTAPVLVTNLAGMGGSGRPLYNVTISNVPGPKETLYWNGARMDGLYPISLLPDGQALNLTLTSYRDEMALGITACRKTLPHVQRLLTHFGDALADLEKAVA